MLKMNVSLAGDVVDNVSDVLSAAAADEVLLRSSVLQEDKRSRTQTYTYGRLSKASSHLCEDLTNIQMSIGR